MRRKICKSRAFFGGVPFPPCPSGFDRDTQCQPNLASQESVFGGTEKAPQQRNCVTKILPNVRVNFLVRFASKPLFYWKLTGDPLELFRKFFGTVRANFWLCGSFLAPDVWQTVIAETSARLKVLISGVWITKSLIDELVVNQGVWTFIGAKKSTQFFLYKVFQQPFGSWTSAPKILDVCTKKYVFLRPRWWGKTF